jgi:serine protease inhibitor
MITLLLALTFQDLQDRPSKFGYELYREVRSEEKDKNVLVSPLSVYLALAMAYNGSGGETRDAMARVLRAEGLTLEDFNRAVASLQKSLTDADPKVKLAIANSLWVNEPVRFHEDFLKRSRDTFQAESVSLPFRDPATLRRINDWVSRNTNGKIEKILDEINPEMLGYLINAVYLKGKRNSTRKGRGIGRSRSSTARTRRSR